MNKYRKSPLYIIARPIVSFLFRIVFWPRILGKENIPKQQGFILAGNHTSNFDCLLLMSSTKRELHFLAKIELFRGIKGLVFNNLGLIPVDRARKNEKAIDSSLAYLKNDEVICIFPEGTTEKGGGLKPFKYGACRLAKTSKKQIVPFVIEGRFIPFNRPTITFLPGISIKDSIEEENNRLYKIIDDKLKER